VQEGWTCGRRTGTLRRCDDLTGISDRGGLVEALVERVAQEGAWRRVVDAYVRVDVSKELAPLRDGHASLQDA
jgi:hypothetical protein